MSTVTLSGPVKTGKRHIAKTLATITNRAYVEIDCSTLDENEDLIGEEGMLVSRLKVIALLTVLNKRFYYFSPLLIF